VSPDRFTRTTFRLWASLLVWAALFLLVYVFVAVACESGFARREVLGVGIVTVVSLGAGLVAAVAIAWVRRKTVLGADIGQGSSTSRFTRFVTAASAGLAAAAVLLLMLPPLLSAPFCSARQVLDERIDGVDSRRPGGHP
jgi:hypothetical protein